MTNWQELLSRHFHSDPDDGCELRLGSPAAKDQLDKFEERIGFRLPDDFRSLYATFNGYGEIYNSEPGKIRWILRPLEEVEQLSQDVGKSLSNTHQAQLSQFLAFYDWGNGDVAGYLRDGESKQLEGLFDFYHERYNFDVNQDFNEFVEPAAKTIEEYIELRIAENG